MTDIPADYFTGPDVYPLLTYSKKPSNAPITNIKLSYDKPCTVKSKSLTTKGPDFMFHPSELAIFGAEGNGLCQNKPDVNFKQVEGFSVTE